jgi:ribosomal protein L14
MAVMMRSMLEVADNSGARKLQMILPLGGSTGLNAGLGDIITAAGSRWERACLGRWPASCARKSF